MSENFFEDEEFNGKDFSENELAKGAYEYCTFAGYTHSRAFYNGIVRV